MTDLNVDAMVMAVWDQHNKTFLDVTDDTST